MQFKQFNLSLETHLKTRTESRGRRHSSRTWNRTGKLTWNRTWNRTCLTPYSSPPAPMQLWDSWEMHKRCISPFKKFSSRNTKEEDTKQMTNFHEFRHLYESLSNSPACPCRVCLASLEQYSIRWQAGWPVVQSPRDTTHTSQQNIRPRGVKCQEEKRQNFYVTITRSCESKCKPP